MLRVFRQWLTGMEDHKPKKLLDQVRDALRVKHYAYRTE
jgi:hypothetical protein